MRMYTNDSAVIAQGVQYFKWMVYCYFLQGMTMTCTIVLRSVGQVNFPLFTSIGSFFVNILFNYMFIFGKLGVPRMEVEGAGVGTLIARVFEFSLICGYFLFVDRKIGYRLKDLRMKCNSLIKVLSRPIIGLYNITPETAQIAGELMDAIAFIVIFLWAASLPLGILAGLVWHLDAFWIYVFLKIDQICKSIWCVFRLRSGKWIKTFSKEKMNHAQ